MWIPGLSRDSFTTSSKDIKHSFPFFYLAFQDSDLLTFNISAHHSWWGEHGPGCVRREMPQAPGVRTTDSQSYITVMGCLLDYQYIEVAHSGAQILVAVSTCEKYKYAHTAHVWTSKRNSARHTLTSETTGCWIPCVWKVKISLFSLHGGHRNHYRVCWSPSSASDIECEIDPLFCLAENEPLQLLTGYSNTGRAVIVPFCAALFEYTRNSCILPACTFAHTRVELDSPAAGPGPGPSLQLSRHLSSDMSTTHISAQWYSATHTCREGKVTCTAFFSLLFLNISSCMR